jgi:cob(I)alamin adenosyltransferase
LARLPFAPVKIYTKQGDAGDTALYGGQKARKDAPRVEAYGQVDELNAAVGLARALLDQADGEVEAILAGLQSDLFTLGAELATPPGVENKASVPITEGDISRLERIIDRLQETLAPQKHFVLPGGTTPAAALHLARTVCRRAERATVALATSEPVSSLVLIYLNRLSDLLFVLARSCNARSGTPDVPWIAQRPAK